MLVNGWVEVVVVSCVVMSVGCRNGRWFAECVSAVLSGLGDGYLKLVSLFSAINTSSAKVDSQFSFHYFAGGSMMKICQNGENGEMVVV